MPLPYANIIMETKKAITNAYTRYDLIERRVMNIDIELLKLKPSTPECKAKRHILKRLAFGFEKRLFNLNKRIQRLQEELQSAEAEKAQWMNKHPALYLALRIEEEEVLNADEDSV